MLMISPIGKAPITWRISAPPNVNNISLDNPVTATVCSCLPACTMLLAAHLVAKLCRKLRSAQWQSHLDPMMLL